MIKRLIHENGGTGNKGKNWGYRPYSGIELLSKCVYHFLFV